MRFKLSTIIGVMLVQILMMPIVWAQEAVNSNTLGSYSWEVIKVIISLVLVLGIFYLFVNIFKKYSGINIKSNSTMKVLGGLSLGGKDKVVILQAGDVNLLLGVSTAGITRLHQFGQNEFNVADNHSLSFGDQIQEILNKKES